MSVNIKTEGKNNNPPLGDGGLGVITAENLTKRFGDFTAVDNINFEVQKGEIFGFLGANGAGKTTAMRMLCGLSLPTSGKATVAGFDIYKENEKIKRNIGYMSQKFSLYDDLTVKENMRFYGGIYGMSDKFIKEKTAFILHHLHLETEGDKLVKSLPLGWKQKLAFSVAIFHEPGIVFLIYPVFSLPGCHTCFYIFARRYQSTLFAAPLLFFLLQDQE